MSKLTKLDKNECDAYIKRWYDPVFQGCFLDFPNEERISEDFISFAAEQSAWDAMIKHRELSPKGHPWIFGERPKTWKEGETECMAYTEYRRAHLTQPSVTNAGKAAMAKNPGQYLYSHNSAFRMPSPAGVDSIDTALRALENVSQDHRAYYQDQELVRHWPCLPTWRLREQGKTVTGGLSGLNEILIVLRRIYAHNISLVPGGAYNNALLQLSCKLLNSLGPDDPLLLKAVRELGRSLCDGKDPSFIAILHHDAMASFWTAQSMCLVQPKMIFSKSGRYQWATWDSDEKHEWIDDLFLFNGHGSIQQLVNGRFQMRTADGYDMYSCCNFPLTIRVHYKPDDPNCLKYNDLQTFDLTAATLSEGDIAKLSGTPVGLNIVTQRYSLIACVFERDKPDDRSEVRTYSLAGKPYIPNTPWQGGWDKRMGTPNVDCFLFYAKCQPQIRLPASEVNPAAATVCFQNLMELTQF
ncbi:hypothetical protein EV127DRAFT_480827 [Xylaria flabelliformis]|nr:hypothetical protein EV127DRAFT_480827 [Xylaria flabelliformis]